MSDPEFEVDLVPLGKLADWLLDGAELIRRGQIDEGMLLIGAVHTALLQDAAQYERGILFEAGVSLERLTQ